MITKATHAQAYTHTHTQRSIWQWNTLEQLYYQNESEARAAGNVGWMWHVLMERAAFALALGEWERGEVNKFYTNHGTSETIKCINTRHKLFTLAPSSATQRLIYVCMYVCVYVSILRILDIRSACTWRRKAFIHFDFSLFAVNFTPDYKLPASLIDKNLTANSRGGLCTHIYIYIYRSYLYLYIYLSFFFIFALFLVVWLSEQFACLANRPLAFKCTIGQGLSRS